MYSPPWSLHCSMWIFHCWKQYGSHLLIGYSRALLLLPSLYLRTPNLFLLTQTWSLEIYKSHGARSGEYGGCSNMVILCFVKNVLTYRALCAGMLSWWRSCDLFFHISCLSSCPFTKVREKLLVVGLNFSHPIHMNKPSDVVKKIIISFNLDLHCRAFFALVKWGSSRAWIGPYFMGCIEKSMIHHKLLCSLKSLVHF